MIFHQQIRNNFMQFHTNPRKQSRIIAPISRNLNLKIQTHLNFSSRNMAFLAGLLLLITSNCVTAENTTAVGIIKESIMRTIQFAMDHYYDMNHDGVLGLAVAHGSLLNLTIPKKYQSDVEEVKLKLEDALNVMQPTLLNFTKHYSDFNHYLIDQNIWTRPPTHGTLQLDYDLPVYPGIYDVNTVGGYQAYLDSSTFAKSHSNQCLLEAATYSDDLKPHVCPFSDECKKFCLSKVDNYNSFWMAYGVTHMLFFLQIARARNCIIMTETEMSGYIEGQCSYILWELKMNHFHGHIKQYDDLMIEQIVFCGTIEGFKDFFDRAYLDYILSIQHPSGCFGVGVLTSRERRRPKRESYMMDNGCNSHTSGLAITALTGFLLHEIEN